MTSRAALCQAVSALSAGWHALIDAAETASDPGERDRLLDLARQVEACDFQARHAPRPTSVPL
jgi:predicted kinase